ncbi:MAG: hypothetical protein GY941_04225 [Planctomycetes bacterium]|nr:hypothetical protein [Planctomycetota bacterium]
MLRAISNKNLGSIFMLEGCFFVLLLLPFMR